MVGAAGGVDVAVVERKGRSLRVMSSWKRHVGRGWVPAVDLLILMLLVCFADYAVRRHRVTPGSP